MRRAYGGFIVLVLVLALLFTLTPAAFATHNECHGKVPRVNELLCALAERPEPEPIEPDQIIEEVKQKVLEIYCIIRPDDPMCSTT